MNIFPVRVLAADGSVRHRDCRMIWDGTKTTVWAWPPGAPKPQPVIRVTGAPVTEGKTHTLGTGDGGVVVVVEQDGCGCGARLKNHTPVAAKPVRAFAEPGS